MALPGEDPRARPTLPPPPHPAGGQRRRDGGGETEARSGAGLNRLPGNANRESRHPGHCPRVRPRSCRPSSRRDIGGGTAFPPCGATPGVRCRGTSSTHGSIFRPRRWLSMLVGTVAPHIPPAGCFSRGSAHLLKLAPALPSHPRPPPAARGALPTHAPHPYRSPRPGQEGEGDKPASSIARVLRATCEQALPGVTSHGVKRSPEVH